LDTKERRALARELSRVANASVDEILRLEPAGRAGHARRIGITGPPGVGKSTLVGALAKALAAAGRGVGVLAIDPASPYSRGAVLGDRIRVAEATDDARIFMRSLSSRDANDGLCNNTADLLHVLEQHGFDDILLETVGVGQAEHAVKTLVDTVVLLLQPETGDAIQALKAGILEVADIVVISKCDLDGAMRMRENIAATMRFGAHRDPGWEVPVVLVSVEADIGLDALSGHIDAHAEWRETHRDRREVEAARTAYRLRDLLMRRVDAVLGEATGAVGDNDIGAAYRWVVDRL
jgi:LAO/AO transport system kinase